MTSTARGWTASALLLAAAVLFAKTMMGIAAEGPGYDLIPLAVAGRLVAAHETRHLYAQDRIAYNRVSDPVAQQAADHAGFPGEPTPFVYPPLVAYLMQPLARVPFSSIARAWTAASILFVLTGLYLVATVYAPAWNGRVAWAVALLVLCAFEPIRYGFWLGQTTAVIFPLVIGSIALERRGKPELAGVALGVAAFIKLTPALVAVFWLWRGPRRAVASFMATLAALWSVSVVALGIQPHVDYVQRLRTISGADVVAYNNHSLVAFLSRFSFAPSAWQDWRMWQAPAVAAGGALLLCALIAGTVIATARDDERWRRRAEAVVFVLMLLAPNIAWTHYFVFLIPGIVVLAADARGLDAAVAAAAVALCSRPFIAAQQQAPAATNAVAVAAPTFAALLIAAALLQDQLRTNREHRMAT